MPAYYNEIDPFAAAWLRELIKKNLIAQGEVDERSIEDVRPEDLKGFTQCHFFAGIGVWSYALRKAGWSDDRPVWTGSCPCQPFSAAGKGKGFTDERHLWPAFHHLISQCRPLTVFGEQVASKDGLTWLDLVSSDLEGSGYTWGATDTCAAGFGAPHIRQRLYWVASRGLAYPQSGRERGSIEQQDGYTGEYRASGMAGGLANAMCQQDRQEQQRPTTDERKGAPELFGGCGTSYHRHPGPTNGFWGLTDWLFCRDGKWRSTQSLDIEMADGIADRLGYSRFGDRWSLNPLIQKAENRVGRLKGYGNAIVAPQAAAFIKAYMEI